TADIQQNATPLDTALTNATSDIQGIYGLGTNPNALTPDYTTAGIGTDAGNLGLVLGAIVNEDQLFCPSTPGGLVTALASDLTDTVFDGKAFGAPVSYCGSGTLPAIAGIADFQDALSGAFGSQLATRAFAFGCTGNILTTNGISASQLSGGISTINSAVISAAPTSVNSFAAGPSLGTNEDREGASATLLSNGSVLIVGGENDRGVARDDSLLYNGTAIAVGPVSNDHVFPGTVLFTNGSVIVAGGLSGAGGSQLTDIFNATGSSISAGPNLVASIGAGEGGAVLLPNGKVFLVDGADDGGPLASTEIYDGTSWTAGPNLSTQREFPMIALMPNGKVLIAGGQPFGTSPNSNDTADIYDPTTNTISTPTSTMIQARQEGTATILPNGKVLIAGGFQKVTGVATPLATTELFDPVTTSFAASGTATMNTARGGMTATLLPNGSVLIAGGGSASTGGGLATTELYDFSKNTFSAGATMQSAHLRATATLLTNGTVFIAGGIGGTTATTSATDIYTP